MFFPARVSLCLVDEAQAFDKYFTWFVSVVNLRRVVTLMELI